MIDTTPTQKIMEPIPKIKYLSAQFQGRISLEEVQALRGAIASTAGPAQDLFHNHKGDQQYIYRYPLIQYKSLGGHAALVCIGEGVDAAQELLETHPLEMEIGGKALDMRLKGLRLKEYPMRVWRKNFAYSIQAWLPLADQTYASWMSTPRLSDRIALLETKLRSNIVAYAHGLGWAPEEEIAATIIQMHRPWQATYKNLPFLAFDLTFMTNLFLPNFVGLGKAAAMGFGVVKQLERRAA